MFHKIFILSLGIFALTGCDAQKKMKNDPKKPMRCPIQKQRNRMIKKRRHHLLYGRGK